MIIIHAGTLLDYYFVLKKEMTAQQRKKLILQQFIEGLINLNQQFTHTNQNYVIKATTYILNERTASKVGFKPVKTDPAQKFILLFNYPNLVVTKSLASKKLSFPEIKKIKTFEVSLKRLSKKQAQLEVLNQKLSSEVI